jgi:peptidyl-prolyl cis-trans isomerase D
VTTPPITAQGRLSNGQPAPNISADLRALLPAAFDSEGEDAKPTVATIQENTRYVLVGVDSTEAAAPPPLAEIRDRVRAQLIRRTAVVRTWRIAQAIAARINAGTPIAQAFAQAGLPLPPPQTITARRQDIMGDRAPESLELFFRLRPGTAGVVAAPNNGGWMVAAPQQSLRAPVAPPQLAVAVRQQLNQVATAEGEWQLVKAMEMNVGVQRNTAAIQAERRRVIASMSAPPQ